MTIPIARTRVQALLLAALVACSADGVTTPANADTLEIAYTVTPGAFWQESAIWLASSDGAHRGMLIDLPDGAERADGWSPDGTTLLFTHTNDPKQEYSLWLVRADGTGLKQLPVGLTVTGAQWTPDGSRIIYESLVGGHIETSSVRPDGSDLRPSPLGQLTTGAVSWSPDGTRVTFERGYSIWVANADGTGEKQITSGTEDYTPSWSPEGSRIAFTTSDASGPTMQIAVINPDGTGRRKVSPGSFDQDPVWSPDGRRIAYNQRTTVGKSSVCTLAIIDAAGGTPTDVMPDVRSNWCPNAVWRRAPALH